MRPPLRPRSRPVRRQSSSLVLPAGGVAGGALMVAISPGLSPPPKEPFCHKYQPPPPATSTSSRPTLIMRPFLDGASEPLSRATRMRSGSKERSAAAGALELDGAGAALGRAADARCGGAAGGSGAWNGKTVGAGRQSGKPARQMRSVGFRCPCATKVRISTSDSGPCCLPSRAMYHWISGCWAVM